jgi:hypothetical protein
MRQPGKTFYGSVEQYAAQNVNGVLSKYCKPAPLLVHPGAFGVAQLKILSISPVLSCV